MNIYWWVTLCKSGFFMNGIVIYQKFIRNLGWNACESIAYHFLLTLHQMALFKVLAYEEYGAIGTAFSLLYLSIWILDFGFDATLAPFWHTWSSTKKNVQRFVWYNSSASIGGLLFLAALLTSGMPARLLHYKISAPLALIIMLAIGSEVLRRWCKTVLQLLFETQLMALAELIFMSIYLVTVWGIYFYGIPLTISTTLLPLAISSLASVGFCIFLFRRWYQELPENHPSDSVDEHDENNQSELPSAWRVIRFRLFAYGNALSTLPFSSNFLVPLFAVTFGISAAGLLKLASSIVHNFTVVLQKTFGNTCRALLAHIRSEDDNQQEAFLMVTHYLYQVLYALLIFCAINHRFIARISGAANTYAGTLLALFFTISFLDNFAITYEKLYEVNERSDILCLFNGLGSILLGCLLFFTSGFISPVTLLLLIALIRLSVLALTTCLTFALYRISPYKTMEPTVILCAIVTSLLFFVSLRNP